MSKLVTSKTATKTTRSKTTPKPKEVVVEEPVIIETPAVEEPVVVETPVVEETTEVDSMKQRFERLIKTKQDLMIELKREVQELKKMQRDHELALKEASKRSRKKRVRDENSTRKPSGFASPVVVSDELYSFLESFGVKKGDPIARTDVTRYVTTYIKDKDLQNPENRREIVPDTVLDRLFGPAMEHKDPNDATSPLVYTYLKLQRYLSQHFPKKATV
jgi:upstream activation factor subunit UAF30|uniref:DM2 domain-containing protein n=1 Tax=viral metagenome TaxID=1070528 RepID=A0A6C0AMU2_9ZZZZ